MAAEWAVFAGPAWPLDAESPGTHLVGLFPSAREAYHAFDHVSFLRLPFRHGRLRWRGTAPFGAAIVQIEHLVARRSTSAHGLGDRSLSTP